ncbi:Uncharacterised protein [Vibrio cholerae]|nr:Uncharacterised protein [Vibrio cholerae]
MEEFASAGHAYNAVGFWAIEDQIKTAPSQLIFHHHIALVALRLQ